MLNDLYRLKVIYVVILILYFIMYYIVNIRFQFSQLVEDIVMSKIFRVVMFICLWEQIDNKQVNKLIFLGIDDLYGEDEQYNLIESYFGVEGVNLVIGLGKIF